MTAAFSRRLRKRKLKSEINVVPYIDVMLVLLVIFMITAPLLNLGVEINLPASDARALESKKDPVEITVEKGGTYKLKIPDGQAVGVTAAEMGAKLAAIAKENPDVNVVIAGDLDVRYDAVYQAMTYVQAAGIDKISLISKSNEAH